MTEVASRKSAAELLRLTSAAWIAQAVSVAAELKVADAMADSAKSAEELAATTATHPAALRRLLRALAGEGLFTQDDEGRFALAPLGAALRSDAPGSVRALCAVRGEPWF